VPHLHVVWDEERVQIKPQQVTRELMKGDPSILIGRVHGTPTTGILISALTLQGDEETVVARRLSEVLKKALT
jgi:hypothetical protein